MGRLDGKSAIVTGGAQGIGAAYVKALAGEGAKVAAADILDCAPLVAAVTAAIPGAEIIALKTDVGDEASVDAMVADTVAAFGRLDVLVNNAARFGGIRRGPFEEIPADEWDGLMGVNVRGPWLCAKAAVPVMRAQKYGKIINIASGTLYKGSPTALHYVSSKGAVLAMTRALSREVGDDGICVNSLSPGLTMSAAVATRPDPQGRHDKTVQSRAFKRDMVPDDLIGALLFLASNDSDFVTGQSLVVDGGSVNN